MHVQLNLPFDGDCQGDEEGRGVGDVLRGVDELRPEDDVDWCLVVDDPEALFEGVLNNGEHVEEGVEATEGHDQLVEHVVQADLAQDNHGQDVADDPDQACARKEKLK